MRPLRALAGAAAMLLLSSCSTGEKASRLTITSVVTASATSASAAPQNSSSAATPGEPGPSAGFAEVVAWVEAAPAADPGAYSTGVDREGKKHDLDPDTVAFTSPSRKITCYDSGGLYCLVGFQKPLPKPSTAYGNWLPGIVMLSTNGLYIGQGRGDPPVFFFLGNGPELPYGQKISFGKGPEQSVCRMEQNGLTCVNKAQGSGALLNDNGVVSYGCLRESTDLKNSAKAYRC